jgi:hypothetical protein
VCWRASGSCVRRLKTWSGSCHNEWLAECAGCATPRLATSASVAVLSIVGGVFSFLPVLGLWMLPLGLLLLAHDVPFLRKPVGRFTSWGAQRWAKFRRPSLSDEAWSELDRPNLPTPPVAVISAPDAKPNPADPLSNPTPTPDIVPPEELPQQLPNEPPTPDIPGAPTPVRPPAGPNHPLGPPEPIERDARTMVRRAI